MRNVGCLSTQHFPEQPWGSCLAEPLLPLAWLQSSQFLSHLKQETMLGGWRREHRKGVQLERQSIATPSYHRAV